MVERVISPVQAVTLSWFPFYRLKGLGHQIDIFSKTFKIKLVLSVHAEMGCLVNKEKKTIHIVSASLKTVLSSKY